jgi:hypothetical protein
MYPVLIWKAKFELSDDKDKKDIQIQNIFMQTKTRVILCKQTLMNC